MSKQIIKLTGDKITSRTSRVKLTQALGQLMNQLEPAPAQTKLELAVSNPYSWKELTLRKLKRAASISNCSGNIGHLKLVK